MVVACRAMCELNAIEQQFDAVALKTSCQFVCRLEKKKPLQNCFFFWNGQQIKHNKDKTHKLIFTDGKVCKLCCICVRCICNNFFFFKIFDFYHGNAQLLITMLYQSRSLTIAYKQKFCTKKLQCS